MKEYKLNCGVRTDLSKGNTNRLRREGKIPAIFYFHHQEPIPISVDSKELYRSIRSRTHIYELNFGGKSHRCILKDVQLDPITEKIIHADFMGVTLEELVKVEVPVHLEGVPIGVKEFGGVLEQHLWEIEIRCPPASIPDAITIDISNLNLGESINVGQIEIDSIEILAPPSTSIVSVVRPTGAKIEAAVEEEEVEKGVGKRPSEER